MASPTAMGWMSGGGGGGVGFVFFQGHQVTPCEESSHLHRNLARDK